MSILACLVSRAGKAADGETSTPVPDDPYYSFQTALSTKNTNASVSSAWQLTTDASSVVVAVIDTGADLEHSDLQENLWVNSDEVPDNDIDDDGNGYVDDVHGYDFKHEDGTPEDEWGHGTLTSGIIGAVGDNGIGTAGVAWKVQLMILKVFGASGGGTVEDFSEAIRYAVQNGAKIINASWTVPGSYPGDQIPALKAAMVEAQEAGILVVAAAGNDGMNLEDSPVFPASYHLDNVVSVAALNNNEEALLEESNYGAESVAVATLGEEVLGPYPSNHYATLTGTSAAAAIVSGVGALMVSQNSNLGASDLQNIMIQTSEPIDALSGLVRSGGTLNPYESIQSALAVDAPGEPSDATEEAGEYTPSTSASSGGCALANF